MSIRLLTISVLLYAMFFVLIGEHTLWEHMRRIASTEEARELTSEIGNTVVRLKEAIGDLNIGNPIKKVTD